MFVHCWIIQSALQSKDKYRHINEHSRSPNLNCNLHPHLHLTSSSARACVMPPFALSVLLFFTSLYSVEHNLTLQLTSATSRALRVNQDRWGHQDRLAWQGFQVQWDQWDHQGPPDHLGHHIALAMWVDFFSHFFCVLLFFVDRWEQLPS